MVLQHNLDCLGYLGKLASNLHWHYPLSKDKVMNSCRLNSKLQLMRKWVVDLLVFYLGTLVKPSPFHPYYYLQAEPQRNFDVDTSLHKQDLKLFIPLITHQHMTVKLDCNIKDALETYLSPPKEHCCSNQFDWQALDRLAS